MARELKTRDDAQRMREDEFVAALQSAAEDVQVLYFAICAESHPPVIHTLTPRRMPDVEVRGNAMEGFVRIRENAFPSI